MNLENLKAFESETVHIAREIIDSKELSPQEKLDAAAQLQRIAHQINSHVVSSRRPDALSALPPDQYEKIADWLKSFRGRG